MTISPKSTALTDEQIVERLAKFMELHIYCACCNKRMLHSTRCDECDCVGLYGLEDGTVFCPTSDWNHWRQVEEKVMEDEKLLPALHGHVRSAMGDIDYAYIRATLPTRCKVLIAALDSLPTHKND